MDNPHPYESCMKEVCIGCMNFQQCRELVLSKHAKSNESMTEIELIAKNNSLGSLAFEEGGFGLEK